MRPLRPFNFNTSAELFPAAIRKKKRAGFTYRRFGGYGYGLGHSGMGIGGVVLVVLVVLLLLGKV